MPHDRRTALPTGFGFGPPRRLGPAGDPAAPSGPRRPAGDGEGRGGSLHSIGAVAREFGVSLRTLRFYEDKGLVAPLRQGTTRLYRSEDRRRLGIVLKGKALGFTLREIRGLVADAEAEPRPDRALALQPDIVRGQIAHLKQQKAEIEAALARLGDYEP